MSDFGHEDVPLDWFAEALDVMDQTPRLTYQILTKRPAVVGRRLASLKRRLPLNAWIGATIGHVQSMPLLKPLRAIEASVRFLSCEPLLTPLPGLTLDGIGWVICGGQSGRGAVPMHPEWARGLRNLCAAAGVPYFFKQWGEWSPYPVPTGSREIDIVYPDGRRCQTTLPTIPPSGQTHSDGGCCMVRVGKKKAGRLLDGREHNDLPWPQPC